jgi:uncharacterized protein
MKRPRGVISFDKRGFADACGALMELVARDRRPDLLIGIRTGGLIVAEAMAREDGSNLPVIAMTCRRPSTAHKARAAVVSEVIGHLPRPVVDRLRVIEHAMLTRKPPARPAVPHRFDEAELATLDAWAGASSGESLALVVDDAVDSGATLLQVCETVRARLPHATLLRSAVITVTTEEPLLRPDYALYQGQLCRFPWSLDALNATPS